MLEYASEPGRRGWSCHAVVQWEGGGGPSRCLKKHLTQAYVLILLIVNKDFLNGWYGRTRYELVWPRPRPQN